MDKLEGLPKIKYINLDRHATRRSFMEENFKKYNITNYERFSAISPEATLNRYLNKNEMGCMMSHLSIISDFYKNSREETMIIMEDDVDISSIDNWDFSWSEFINAMPNFEILQIVRNQEHQLYAKLKKWEWSDKSTAAYVITRGYAEKVSRLYAISPTLRKFPHLFQEPGWPHKNHVGPVADYSLYKNFATWSTCIFKQTLNLESEWSSTSLNPEPIGWYLKQNAEMEEFWSTKHSLKDIL